MLPVIVHGDAAFAGQGVVMETLALAQTRGYYTGGTMTGPACGELPTLPGVQNQRTRSAWPFLWGQLVERRLCTKLM